MIVAVAITILGLVLGIGVVQLTGLRMSGVLVIPLVAVYGLYDLLAVPILVISGLAAYATIVWLERRTLVFGRPLLAAGMIVSVLVPVALSAPATLASSVGATVDPFVALASILPGVAAYNYRQLDPERRREDLGVSLAALASLTLFGLGLIASGASTLVRDALPPVLVGADAAVAAELGVAIRGADPSFAPLAVVVPAVLLGLVLFEAIYDRWGVRLVGTIALPLLALFALQDVAYLALYLAGLPVACRVVGIVHRQTLLYGRVLLALSIVVAVSLAVPVGYAVGQLSGFHLYFVAIFVGVGAYNVHRVPTADRRDAVALSAAIFVAFAGALRTAVRPGQRGLYDWPLEALATPEVLVLADATAGLELALSAIALAAGAVAAWRLEQLRHQVSRDDARTAGGVGA